MRTPPWKSFGNNTPRDKELLLLLYGYLSLIFLLLPDRQATLWGRTSLNTYIHTIVTPYIRGVSWPSTFFFLLSIKHRLYIYRYIRYSLSFSPFAVAGSHLERIYTYICCSVYIYIQYPFVER